MKKLLLSIPVLALFTTGIKAQTIDYGLDTWANTACASVQDPVGWASFNLLTCFPASMQQTVFKETTPTPYSGVAAARIETKKIPAFITVPGYDTVGLLVAGSIDLAGTTPTIHYGVPYTGRPASITFATKYASTSLDTGWVLVQLTKWNTGTNKADTIASGRFNTSASSSTWTLQTINLSSAYTVPAVSPDTLKIYCSSSSLYRPKIGSTLWVDAFSFHGWVSTNDIDGVKNTVSLYPNPSNSRISIECSVTAKMVDVMDVAGKKIGSYPMKGNKVEIETLEFSQGLYFYQVVDADQKILNRGKFEVAH